MKIDQAENIQQFFIEDFSKKQNQTTHGKQFTEITESVNTITKLVNKQVKKENVDIRKAIDELPKDKLTENKEAPIGEIVLIALASAVSIIVGALLFGGASAAIGGVMLGPLGALMVIPGLLGGAFAGAVVPMTIGGICALVSSSQSKDKSQQQPLPDWLQNCLDTDQCARETLFGSQAKKEIKHGELFLEGGNTNIKKLVDTLNQLTPKEKKEVIKSCPKEVLTELASKKDGELFIKFLKKKSTHEATSLSS